jgi:hypothetical protein
VNGGVFITDDITSPGSAGTYTYNATAIDYSGSGARFWSWGDATTRGTFDFIQLENDGQNQQTPLSIDSSGNVGIGTTSPRNDANFITLQVGNTTTAASQIVLDDNDSNGPWRIISNQSLIINDDTTERMRIDSSGSVTVSSGNVQLVDSNKRITVDGSDIRIWQRSANNIQFLTNDLERLRITSDGDVLFGTQGTPNGTSIYGSAFSSGSVNRMILSQASSWTGTSTLQTYYNPNGAVGSIKTNGSSTSFNTSSDYRLKENVVEMTGALDRVSQLKPSRFNFIADADKTVDGFLAHEVQEIVPEAISGEKDAMQDEEYEVSPAVYEDVVHPAEEAVYETIEHPSVEEELDDEGNIIVEGKEAYTEEVLVTEAKEEWTEKVLVSEKVMGTREVPDYQGIDQSKLVPLLVGAIQELKAEIESLKLQINN